MSTNSNKPKQPGNDGTVYRCPMCKKLLQNTDIPTFPFCSDQCRLLDLNNWVEGKYQVTRPIDPTDLLGDDK